VRWGLVPLAALIGALALTPAAWAETPTDQLRATVERAIKILEDPELKTPARAEERRARIKAVAHELFNFKEVARRALGRHWRERTPAEQEEFTALFTELLERTYLGRIDLYGGERVQYVAETIDGDFAFVGTRVLTKEGPEVPVEYRMLRNSGRWEVYDVIVEGVSLVGNYRSQFNRIIQASSYEELAKKLKARTLELGAGGGEKPRPKGR